MVTPDGYPSGVFGTSLCVGQKSLKNNVGAITECDDTRASGNHFFCLEFCWITCIKRSLCIKELSSTLGDVALQLLCPLFAPRAVLVFPPGRSGTYLMHPKRNIRSDAYVS